MSNLIVQEPPEVDKFLNELTGKKRKEIDSTQKDVARMVICWYFGNPSNVEEYKHPSSYLSFRKVTKDVLVSVYFRALKRHENLLVKSRVLVNIFNEVFSKMGENEDDSKVQAQVMSGNRIGGGTRGGKKKSFGEYVAFSSGGGGCYNGVCIFDYPSTSSVLHKRYFEKLCPNHSSNYEFYSTLFHHYSESEIKRILDMSSEICSEYYDFLDDVSKEAKRAVLQNLKKNDAYFLCREIPEYRTKIEIRKIFKCEDYEVNKMRRVFKFELPAYADDGWILIDRDGLNVYYQASQDDLRYEDIHAMEVESKSVLLQSSQKKYKEVNAICYKTPVQGASTAVGVMKVFDCVGKGEYTFRSAFPNENIGRVKTIQNNRYPVFSMGPNPTKWLHFDLKVPVGFEHPPAEKVLLDVENGNFILTFFEKKKEKKKKKIKVTPSSSRSKSIFDQTFQMVPLNLQSASESEDEDLGDEEDYEGEQLNSQVSTPKRKRVRNQNGAASTGSEDGEGRLKHVTKHVPSDNGPGSICKIRIGTARKPKVLTVCILHSQEGDLEDERNCVVTMNVHELGKVLRKIKTSSITHIIRDPIKPYDTKVCCTAFNMTYNGTGYFAHGSDERVLFEGTLSVFANQKSVDPISKKVGDRCHGKVMPPGWCQVSVEMVLEHHENHALEEIQIAFGNETLGSLKGSYVMWPRICVFSKDLYSDSFLRRD